MRERELGRMQELAPEQRLGDAVGRVTDDRQVDRLQVHANLMHAAGFERHPEQRVLLPQLDHLEVRDRLTCRFAVERDARGVGAIASDRCLDPARA